MQLRAVLLAALGSAAVVTTSVASAQPARPPQAPQEPAPVIPPKLLSDAQIPYPEGAAGDATVLLVLTVGADGTVESAVPTEPHEPFSSRAADAALTWRFDPATRGGKPVASRIRLEIVFHAPVPAPPEPGPTAEPGPEKPGAPPSRAQTTVVEEVNVHGARGEPSRTVSLSRAEVRQIPGTFGDPFRAIEVMPGVTPIVSGLPFFFVRGAPPGDVGYFLDGVRVPYLFHVGAGPSVIHPGLIDTVDLYPGGYPARFGRFSGGIVSGETVDPKPEVHGEYNVRVFDAGALAEAPFDDGRGIALVGGRYSYTAGILSLVSPSTELDYWDYQGRVSYDLTKRDRVTAFGFGAYDFLGQKTPTSTLPVFGAEFHRLDLRYDHKLDENGTLRTAVTGGIDYTELSDGQYVRDRLVGTRTELTYRLSPKALLRAGTDAEIDSYDVVLGSQPLSPAEQSVASYFPSRSDLALGTRADVVLEVTRILEVTPGVRFDFYGSEGSTAIAVDPRLATRTTLDDRIHLLTALGVAHQPPAFVIPIPGFQPGGLKGGLQTAVQESTGIEVDLGHATIATATVFHNAFYNMSDALSVLQPSYGGCAPGTYPSGSIGGDFGSQPDPNRNYPCTPRFPPGTVGPDRSGGGAQGAQNSDDTQQAQAFETRARGTAYGLELYVKRRLTDRFGGFLSYTLSRSIRTANGQTFIASFDRTHVLNVAAAYDLGRNWRAGTRFTFYTGLPKAPDPSDPSSTRLDPFYRVDLRLEKRWQLSQRWWISFVAEWLNATLTKESVGTNCTLNGCQDTKIGPVTIPSIGVEGGF